MSSIVELGYSEEEVLQAIDLNTDAAGWAVCRDVAGFLDVSSSSAAAWLAWARARDLVEVRHEGYQTYWGLTEKGASRLPQERSA